MNIKIKCPKCGADVNLSNERCINDLLDIFGTQYMFLSCDCCDCQVTEFVKKGFEYKHTSIQLLNKWVEKYGCNTLSIKD